jgi:Outer membrane protein beta-barrel domain
MHDPKFEKEVQQKMSELEFSPSESVWANIGKEINQQRHTRRGFRFFWRLALPALLLLAGGGYFFFRSAPATGKTAASSTATETAPPMATETTPRTATETTPQTATETAPPTAMAPVTTSSGAPVPAASSVLPPVTAASSNSSKPGANEAKTISPFAEASNPHRNRTSKQLAGQSTPPVQMDELAAVTETGSATRGSATKNGAKDGRAKDGRAKDGRAKGGRKGHMVVAAPGLVSSPSDMVSSSPNMVSSSSDVVSPSSNVVSPSSGLTTAASGAGSGMVAAPSGAGRQPFVFNPALASLKASAAAVHANKLATKNTVALKTLQSPHRPWEAAFSGGIGVSSLHQVRISNVALSNAAPSFNSRDSASNSLTYSAARPSKQYISNVKSGVAFWAGVLAHKSLSDRWGLSIGLNLSYFSSRVRVGEQVNNYTPSTATLLTSSAIAPIQSYPYYSAGNEQAYTNRYYFMELPVAAEWRINRSHLLPLFWDGGFSVSYLMGSSAVYYNTKSGVYFKDGGVANHTQFNISTALMVGLPVRGLRVQLGPQIQYGLTPLLNTQLSGSQHIFYGGLRLVIYPGRK